MIGWKNAIDTPGVGRSLFRSRDYVSGEFTHYLYGFICWLLCLAYVYTLSARRYCGIRIVGCIGHGFMVSARRTAGYAWGRYDIGATYCGIRTDVERAHRLHIVLLLVVCFVC